MEKRVDLELMWRAGGGQRGPESCPRAVGSWGSPQRRGCGGLSFAVCLRAVQALRRDVGLPQLLLPLSLLEVPRPSPTYNMTVSA